MNVEPVSVTYKEAFFLSQVKQSNLRRRIGLLYFNAIFSLYEKRRVASLREAVVFQKSWMES